MYLETATIESDRYIKAFQGMVRVYAIKGDKYPLYTSISKVHRENKADCIHDAELMIAASKQTGALE